VSSLLALTKGLSMDIRFRVTRMRFMLLVAVLALIAAGVAYAAIPSDGTNLFTGCMLRATGTVRLIDPSGPSSSLLSRCTQFETQISWNQKGQAGKDGTNGAPGKNGVNGTDGTNGKDGAACLPANPACVGPQGVAGKDGLNGTNGTPGTPGPKGDAGSGFTWRGAYQDRTIYNAGDVVSFDGSSWITNEGIGSGDIAPPEDPWQPVAVKGADGTDGVNGTNGSAGAAGATGAQGAPGAQGPAGPTGPQGPQGPAGSVGDTRWVIATAAGGITAQSANAGIVSLTHSGDLYLVDFNRDMSHCAAVASAEDVLTAVTLHPFNGAFPGRIIVELFHGYNLLGEAQFQTANFDLVVYC
jgi:hypothetical protein